MKPPPPLPGPHMSGKRVVVGHTPQADGQVMDRGHLVCIDTYCFGYGYLTAYEVGGKAKIQADRQGPSKAFTHVCAPEKAAQLEQRMQTLDDRLEVN